MQRRGGEAAFGSGDVSDDSDVARLYKEATAYLGKSFLQPWNIDWVHWRGRLVCKPTKVMYVNTHDELVVPSRDGGA